MQGCVGAVERVLKKLPGVTDFAISLEEKKVKVQTDGSVDADAVKATVAKTGKATEFW